MSQSQTHRELSRPSSYPEQQLEQQLLDFEPATEMGESQNENAQKNPVSTTNGEQMLMVMNSDTYFAAREALYKNTFGETDGVPWPTAQLGEDGKYGLAQLRPVQADASHMMTPEEHKRWTSLMWKHREELSDLDADILDSLSALWLLQAQNPDADAVADVDDLLRMRNLQPKLGGKGGRGGFRPQQRQAVNNALAHIQSVWLNVVSAPLKEGESGSKLTIQSRAFVITDRMGQLHLNGGIDIRKFIFRPGKVFAHFLYGPGRPTAFLSARALQYDTYRQTWEKRLARFLSWQWGSQREQEWYGQTYTVQQLLDAVGEGDSTIRPGKLRERLEKALDTLGEDGLIASWQYDYQENPLPKRKWKEPWLSTTVLVEPPVQLVEHYEFLEEKAQQAAELPGRNTQTFAERIKLQRKKLGWTQKQTANFLDISQAHLSRMERDKMKEDALSAGLRKRIEDWLQYS